LAHHRTARADAATSLYDYRTAIEHRKGLAEALDARPVCCRETDIDDDHMVLGVIDDFLERPASARCDGGG